MFQVGFARVDVTPPLGTPLTGYFYKRLADGVLDPIELNALAVTSGDDTVVIITGDFMSTPLEAMTRYRTLVSEATGLPLDHIMTQSVHQHTSTSPTRPDVECFPDYLSILERKYCDVARMALDDRAEATLALGQKETAEPVSFVRRFRMKDGTTATNPGFLNPNILEPLGKADNTVRLVKIMREGAKDIALVGFATHPDTISGNKFTADWPGFVRRQTEQALENVHCILVNGCQGDTNHFNVNKERPSSVAEVRYETTRQMAQKITDKVLELWDEATPAPAGKISAAYTVLNIPSNTDGIERIEECKELLNVISTREGGNKYSMADKGEIRRIANMESLNLFHKVPVAMVAFGPVALVGYGGEPFTEYADVLREAYPDLFILTACNCDGAQGYLPSLSAFQEGGYEARTSNFTPSVAPKAQGAAKEMLKNHINSL